MQLRGLLGSTLCWLALIVFVIGCGGEETGKGGKGTGSKSTSGDSKDKGDSGHESDDTPNGDAGTDTDPGATGTGDTGDTDTGDTDTGDTDTGDTDTGDTDTGDTDTGDTDTGDTDTGDNADTGDADTAATGDGEWGNLIVRFVYDGEAPAAVAVVPDGADAAFCGTHDLVKEDLVVNPDNNGVANIVGWLSVARGEDPPAAHPSNEAAKAESVVLDNIGCRFEPHMTIVQTGQTLIVKNSDEIGHNTKVNLLKNKDQAFNDNLPAGRQLEKSFENAESLPMIVECTQHKWMTARLFILDHPFFGKTDADGKLVIENLPVGTWNIRFNHEVAGNLQGVQVGTGETSRRGEVEITIKPGDNDLGEIKLPAEMFAK